jgi:predicted aspartyl protease
MSRNWLYLAIVVLILLAARANAQSNSIDHDLATFLAHQGFAKVQLNRTPLGAFEVEASINGNHNALLIVDTGASHTVFDKDRMKDMGLTLYKTEVQMRGVSGKTDKIMGTDITDLIIGDAHAGPMSLFVADLSSITNVQRSSGTKRVDGLIGLDFLTRYSSIIDIKHSILYLRVK